MTRRRGKREKERERERSSRMSTLPGEGGSENAAQRPTNQRWFRSRFTEFHRIPCAPVPSRAGIHFNPPCLYAIRALMRRVFSLKTKISIPLKKVQVGLLNTFQPTCETTCTLYFPFNVHIPRYFVDKSVIEKFVNSCINFIQDESNSYISSS